jgi:predicted SnoaL-like aldol condensation-catalyzing enzyme
MTHTERVRHILAGISAGDLTQATEYIHPTRFLQHNPYAADGVEGLRHFIQTAPREALTLEVVRIFEDGPFVVAQLTGHRSGKEHFFDVFRFEDGLVVEHWAFSAPGAPPNASGHTQLDGPREPQHLEDTARTKDLVRHYYERFHLAGDHTHAEDYFAGDLMIRHEPGVADGVSNFLQDVKELMKGRTIDEIGLLLGAGDWVFLAARGTHRGAACVYVDLYRVAEEKIVEHWGFPEMVPGPEQSRNINGML